MRVFEGLYVRLWKWGKQFVKFAAVGASGVLVDFTVYVLLTRGFGFWREHFLLANIVSFLASSLNNFLWHRYWTFAGTKHNWWRQYFHFLAVSSIYLLFIQFGMWLLVTKFGWYDLMAKLAVIGVGVFIYFGISRKWIFKPAVSKTEGIDSSE